MLSPQRVDCIILYSMKNKALGPAIKLNEMEVAASPRIRTK